MLVRNLLQKVAPSWREAKSLFLRQRVFFANKLQQETVLRPDEDNLKLPQNRQLFDREYFRVRADHADYEAYLREQQLKKVEEENKRINWENKQNDRNPQNIVPVILNSPVLDPPATGRNIKLQPFILRESKPPEKIIIVGIRKNLRSSVKKMYRSAFALKKMHVLDALHACRSRLTKPAQYLEKCLAQTINHAKLRGYQIDRLFIRGIQVGRQRRYKMIRYHAKNKHGIMNKDFVRVRIELENIPALEMYKKMFKGQTPPAVAFYMRQQIVLKGMEYSTIQKYQFMLTSKGRQQTRLFMKRRALKRHLEFKKLGQIVPVKLLYEKIVDEEAQKWADDYERRKEQISTESISKRMAIFKKNEEATR